MKNYEYERIPNYVMIKENWFLFLKLLQHAANHFTIKSFTVVKNIKRLLL